MIDISHQIHLVQTKEWNEFKKNYGNRVEKVEDCYILIKKIPLSSYYMGYSPKVNFETQNINFKKLKTFCIENDIAFVRFDIPNLFLNSKEGERWNNILKSKCKLAPRNTFTKQNILLDISPSTEELLKNMHSKRRYNIRYAKRKGVKTKVLQTKEGFENFWKLHKKTAERQGFLTHPKKYFKTQFRTLKDVLYFVEASIKGEIAASWAVYINNKTIYYVYGGSSYNPKHYKKYPSDRLGFEVIKLGKKKDCTLFDMWGAEEDKGFTNFKLRYGGELVEYLPTYDFVINSLPYNLFNISYNSFWTIQNLKKKIKNTFK